MTQEELCATLVKIREEIGKTQGQIAAEIGVKQVTVSAWETGRNEPSLENIAKYAAACGHTFKCEFHPRGGRPPRRDAPLSEQDQGRLEAIAHALSTVDGLARDLLLMQIDGIAEVTKKSFGSHAGEMTRRSA